MSMTIWKYPLTDSELTIPLSEGGMVLSAQAQYGTPSIWVLHDPDKPARRYRVFTVPTGVEVSPDATRFIGTLQLEGGRFVLHIFTDETPVPAPASQVMIGGKGNTQSIR